MMRIPVALALAALAAEAVAQDEVESAGRLAAIQQRKFRMDHEIAVSVGYLPLDAFYKGYTVEGGYTLHFSDWLAWEVARGAYSFNISTKLREQLEKDFQVQPTAFEQVQATITSAAMLVPAYGKYAFMNRVVVHSEFYLVIGGMGAWTTQSFKLGPVGGAGFRFFISELVSVRFDARYALVAGGSLQRPSMTQIVSLSLGFGLDFGSAD